MNDILKIEKTINKSMMNRTSNTSNRLTLEICSNKIYLQKVEIIRIIVEIYIFNSFF